MKRKITIIGSVLVVAIIIFTLIHRKEDNMFPIIAEDVDQMTFAINPYDSQNYTITDDKRIVEIVDSINNLGLREPDAEAEDELDGTTYLLWCWYGDGSSDQIRIILEDVIEAQDENGRKKYTADCTKLLSILDATYWDRRNGEID